MKIRKDFGGVRGRGDVSVVHDGLEVVKDESAVHGVSIH